MRFPFVAAGSTECGEVDLEISLKRVKFAIFRRGYIEIGQVVSVLAVTSLIYAPISIFRLNYTLSIAIVVVTLHQLLAPNRDLDVANERSGQPISYETIKAKWE